MLKALSIFAVVFYVIYAFILAYSGLAMLLYNTFGEEGAHWGSLIYAATCLGISAAVTYGIIWLDVL
ncbi:MAG: hypothetical protein AAFX41_10880 [Bacteroidota bacterium]